MHNPIPYNIIGTASFIIKKLYHTVVIAAKIKLEAAHKSIFEAFLYLGVRVTEVNTDANMKFSVLLIDHSTITEFSIYISPFALFVDKKSKKSSLGRGLEK